MNNTAKGLVPSGHVPPKKWDDITDAEKIERMREIIKSLQSWVGRTQSDVHHVRENFSKHSHTDKGIVVPFNEYNNSNTSGVAASLGNEGYF